MAVTNNTLGGVILAGDSWLSGTKNTQRISEQIKQPVTNVAVGGFTTQDTINQLNSFLQNGGTFAPNSTVMLDVGGNDLLQNVNSQTIKSNLQQLVSTLGNNGVKVVLSGAPEVSSISDVTGSSNLKINNIFKDVAQNNANVTLVDSMANLLNQKNLVDETGFHLNEAGQTAFNAALSNAYLESQGQAPIKYSDQAIKDFVVNNNLTTEQAKALAPSFGLSTDRVSNVLVPAAEQATKNTWNYDEYQTALRTGGDPGEQVASYLASNPNLTDVQIASAMAEFGVSPAQMAAITGLSEGDVVSRIAKTLTPGQNINLGGVWVQPVYDSTGQGETFEQGQLKEVLVYNQNQQTGDTYKQYSPTGEYIKSGQFKDTGNFGDLLKDMGTAIGPIALMALTAGGAGGVLGSSLGLSGTAANVVGGALLGGGGAALTGQDVLKGALLGGAGGYFQGANAGFGPQTDASFLAADAAQLAGQGLSESTIAQVLGASGYASDAAASLAASMAVNGLDVGMMTQQLDALSTNTGLMSQTGSAADFAAADALQLQGQVGNNFAAIEQNLIASGVDPLVAADISQQIAFNPGLTQADLATNLANNFGDNIYDVNMATTYPTSVLPDAGGLLSDVPGAAATVGAGATTAGTGLTSAQIANLLKAGISLATISGAVNAAGGGGTNTPMQTPTQGVPTNDPNYYNQLQQYYNAYLPQTPRDVVAPLQQWYEGSFGSTGTNTAVSPQQAQTAMPPAPSGTAMPAAPVRPTTPTPVRPTTPLPVSSTPVPAAASSGLFSTPMTAQQQVQNLLSSPNLSSLPPEAAAAISRAVSAPRSYNDVVASGGQNTVDVSSLSPEVQRAYDLYQQSMILGANSSEVRKAYERAGVNPTNPDAFFAGQGLLTGTPTQAALSQYAPLALDRFAKSGGGALTFTVDPSTIPSTYTAPTIPDISFNMDRFIQSINNNTTIGADAKQRIIAEQATKRGFNPSEFI